MKPARNWKKDRKKYFFYLTVVCAHECTSCGCQNLFIGEIVETYADESVLTEGKVDLAKLKPLLFDMSSVKYWSVGEAIAGCWNIGKQLKKL